MGQGRICRNTTHLLQLRQKQFKCSEWSLIEIHVTNQLFFCFENKIDVRLMQYINNSKTAFHALYLIMYYAGRS